MLFKITQKQVGNGIGSILASIGIPIILDALMPKRGTGAVRMGRSVDAATRIGAPPPFIGTLPAVIVCRACVVPASSLSPRVVLLCHLVTDL